MTGNDSHDEDAVLVSLCKGGDRDAFERLVERHEKRMFTIAYRMTGSYEDACEIVQDAFVAAWRAIRQFEGRSRFSTWLYTIVMNHTRNFLRKDRFRRVEVSLDDPGEAEGGSIRPEPASAASSVLDSLERKELQVRVQKCIDALDPEFREVLVLRDIQGFSYDEIGALLKLAAGTVKSRLFRARDSMKNCLKGLLGRG